MMRRFVLEATRFPPNVSLTADHREALVGETVKFICVAQVQLGSTIHFSWNCPPVRPFAYILSLITENLMYQTLIFIAAVDPRK